jgi:hypothetical protein
VNALLNYLFALVEIESVLACHRVGIDPGLGIIHLDTRSRQSMALDLMEPVRPRVEFWTLELLAQRAFKRSDFMETPDGHVRILAPLSHELADTMLQWRMELAPWVEGVAHLFGDAVQGKYVPATPLTKTNNQRAQASVRARKARANTQRRLAQRASDKPPRQEAGDSTSLRMATCVSCGGTLARNQHIRCPTCWELLGGQDAATRALRGVAISESKQASKRWRVDNPNARGDPEHFRTTILPGLRSKTLADIMNASGLSKATASKVRAGRQVPHLRHWAQLMELGNTTPDYERNSDITAT